MENKVQPALGVIQYRRGKEVFICKGKIQGIADIESMTPLQLLDFQKLQTILSHFDGFFGVFMSQERFSKAFFANFLPLSPNENGVLTFLQ